MSGGIKHAPVEPKMTSHEPFQRRLNRLDTDLYCSASRAYFLTICSDRSAPYFADLSLSRMIMSCLLAEAVACGILVSAYCPMPDHLHVLCSPAEEGRSVITFMHDFKGRSTRLGWDHGIRGKLWQKGYYDHIVRREESLRKIAEYILANPVRKGLVGDYTAYEFSGMPDSLPDWW